MKSWLGVQMWNYLLPAVTYRDVINFLVFTPSPYTADDLRCYKGLDAYNQFVCGWVRETASCVINNMHLTTAKVRTIKVVKIFYQCADTLEKNPYFTLFSLSDKLYVSRLESSFNWICQQVRKNVLSSRDLNLETFRLLPELLCSVKLPATKTHHN